MVENIKITAREIKRILKLSIYLPKNYNENNKSYPLIYVFDGQMMFHSLDDENKTFDLPDILDSSNTECICIGLHSPKVDAWRLSELCPYYRNDGSEVDPSYSFNYLKYIEDALHPLLKQRYRINDNVYLLGFNEGAIASLYGSYHHNLFKGSGIFSPKLEICDGVINDIEDNFNSSKALYLFHGDKGSNNTTLFYNLYTRLEGLHCEKLKLVYEENEENNHIYWQNHIKDFLSFILK